MNVYVEYSVNPKIDSAPDHCDSYSTLYLWAMPFT